jgi:lipopolysaccharide transport system permease protein
MRKDFIAGKLFIRIGVIQRRQGARGMGNNVSSASKSAWFKEFWNYRELFYFFIWRDIKVKYKQTVIGALWAIIQPVCTMIVFTIFFGKFANMPSDGVPYPIFSYCALVPWIYFSGALSYCGNCLVGNSNLLTKIYFPRIVIPISATLAGLLDFFIASVILLGLILYYHIPITWGLLLWPVLVIPLILFALGLGVIFASLNVKYRDIKYTIPFGIQTLLFVTPIIYPMSILPEKYRPIVSLNPLTGIMEAFRGIVLPNKSVDYHSILYSMVVILLTLVVGIIFFRKTEKRFADVI